MPRRGAKRSDHRTDSEFDKHATSLVMRRLPQHVTIERLVEILNQTLQGKFDFVHVPQDQTTGLNVALAFVNFVDHDSAARAYRTRLMRPNGRSPLGETRIRPGTIQGLGPNLAFFISRFGLDALDGPSAPHVFVEGRRASLTVHTLHNFMTFDMLKSQMAGPHDEGIAVSSRINHLSWLFPPTECSASTTPTPAAASLSGRSTSVSNVQAWLDGHRSDQSSQYAREQADSNTHAAALSSQSDLSSATEKDAGEDSVFGHPGEAQSHAALSSLSKYREGGVTVFQL